MLQKLRWSSELACYDRAHYCTLILMRLPLSTSQLDKAREFKLGVVAGLKISATPSAIVGNLMLWILLSVVAYLLKLSLLSAVIGGFLAMVLHNIADLWHQLGHSWAARSTGYPMIGVRFGFLGVLSTSVYPADEIPLAPAVHIRRALGGPTGSLLMSAIAGVIFLTVKSRGFGTLWLLTLWFFLENLLVFTLGVFLPLGFTDVNTIVHWMRQTKPGDDS